MLSTGWLIGLAASSIFCPQALGAITACPTKETKWTAQNRFTYSICPNTDYQGGGRSLQMVRQINTVEACATICSKDPRCVKAVYDKRGKICHVKDNANNMNWEKDASFVTIRIEDETQGLFISRCPSNTGSY